MFGYGTCPVKNAKKSFMKNICFYFEVDEPLRLKRFRFFDMGKDHYDYLDDPYNRSAVQEIAANSYLPMNDLLLELIEKYEGKFKVSFSISGLTIEALRTYAPAVLKSFKKLSRTKCVEFIAATYSHSLSSLVCEEEFVREVERNKRLIEKEFGQKPVTFVNTELIYSDLIGKCIADMGFTGMIIEGAKHVMGWKSPDFVYTNSINPRLKLLIRNASLSEAIVFRFADTNWVEWPLTVEKFTTWALNQHIQGEVINLSMSYETFGHHIKREQGIFDFMRYLPEYMLDTGYFAFAIPREVTKKLHPVAILSVPHAISWTDEEKDVTPWMDNELQEEALGKLYAQREKVMAFDDPEIHRVWDHMQNADHFYYMSTKWFSGRSAKNYDNPYDSPYDAFINYMNVLSDFIRRLDKGTAERGNA